MSAFKTIPQKNIKKTIAILKKTYPQAKTELRHKAPLQLLIATILSAQCTDKRVNKVTPSLFKKYPDVSSFARANREVLESEIKSTGFYKNKTRSILTCCKNILEKHGGNVPKTMEELTALGGVGRKTANVVLGNAFGIPGVVVDTHVKRLSFRIGFSKNIDPEKIEFDLMKIIPKNEWTLFSHLLIFHGRRVCIARKPQCPVCPIQNFCSKNDVAGIGI